MINCQFENGNKASLRHCTVDAVIFNDDKSKILLARRAEHLTEAGKWCLPGGYMERDETIAQTAERETYEETGYELKDLVFIKFNDDPNRNGGDRQNVNFLYSATANKRTGKPDEETSEIRWFNLDSLPDNSQIAFDHYEVVLEVI